jgi:hypothetical protein
MLEMQIVVQAVLARCELQHRAGFERTKRRNIAIRPGQGALATVRDRQPAADAASSENGARYGSTSGANAAARA